VFHDTVKGVVTIGNLTINDSVDFILSKRLFDIVLEILILCLGFFGWTLLGVTLCGEIPFLQNTINLVL
jgi:hypothetical protein